MLVSVVLHAALIYAVSRDAWLAAPPPTERRSPPVIWLDLPPPAPPAPEIVPDAPDPRRVTTPAPEPAPATAEAPPARAEPEVRDEPDEAREQDSGDERLVESIPVPAPPMPPEIDRDAEEPIRAEPPSVDLEAHRQRAVALVIERQAREREYRTFSLDDLIEEPPPDAVEPGADQDVFAPSSSSGPAAMRPSRARTRIGRALSEICNDLTGGIGVFGLFSLCAEEDARADFFGHLRPAYLEKLPVCTEHELTEAQLAAAQITDPSEIETTVVKCRLVDRDAVLVVPE